MVNGQIRSHKLLSSTTSSIGTANIGNFRPPRYEPQTHFGTDKFEKGRKEMVGTGRFELPTPRTPSECATRLRHVPTEEN
jgi:hypothetical protein